MELLGLTAWRHWEQKLPSPHPTPQKMAAIVPAVVTLQAVDVSRIPKCFLLIRLGTTLAQKRILETVLSVGNLPRVGSLERYVDR